MMVSKLRVDRIKRAIVVSTFGVFIFIILNSCHKFAEDPFISLRAPNDRLKRYAWTVTSYQINGTEHIHDFDSILSPRTLKDLTLEFADDGYKRTIYRFYYVDSHKEVIADGRTNFTSVNTITIGATSYSIMIDTLLVERFWDTPNIRTNTQGLFSDWGVRELYKKNCHLRRNNIDIYLKGK